MTTSRAEDRRKHQRILLPEDQFLNCKGLDPKFDGKVTVIGTGGLFIRTKQSLSMGQKVRLKVEDPALNFEVQATVRDASEKGAGVEFDPLDNPHQRTLQAFLSKLRP